MGSASSSEAIQSINEWGLGIRNGAPSVRGASRRRRSPTNSDR